MGAGGGQCTTAWGAGALLHLVPRDTAPKAAPPPTLSVSRVWFTASPRRQAHGLRQHTAASRDDVRPAQQGPRRVRPQAPPRATLDPLLLCKVCIYSPLGLQRGWGAGQRVCSLDKEGGRWRGWAGALSRAFPREASRGEGRGPEASPPPLFAWPLPC